MATAWSIGSRRGCPCDEARTHRLLGLELRRLERDVLSRSESPAAAGSSSTPSASTRSRSTRPSTACRAARPWRRGCTQTPPGFIFAVKASRYLTHIRRLQDLDQGIPRFYERIEPLLERGRLGPVLWQLPANFHRDDQRLAGWLEALPEGRHTIEFRHPSWFAAPVHRRRCATTGWR